MDAARIIARTSNISESNDLQWRDGVARRQTQVLVNAIEKHHGEELDEWVTHVGCEVEKGRRVGRVVEDVELSQRDFFRELQRAPEDDLQCSHRHHLCDTIQLSHQVGVDSGTQQQRGHTVLLHVLAGRVLTERPQDSDVDSRAARRRFVVIGVHDRVHVEHLLTCILHVVPTTVFLFAILQQRRRRHQVVLRRVVLVDRRGSEDGRRALGRVDRVL